MKIKLRRIFCYMDNDDYWVENDGRNLPDLELADDECRNFDEIKSRVMTRLSGFGLDMSSGLYKWSQYGDDWEIVKGEDEEPVFHITIEED